MSAGNNVRVTSAPAAHVGAAPRGSSMSGSSNLRGSSMSAAGAHSAVGTTRNRTDLFLKYRNQARGVRPVVPGGDESREASRLLDTAIGSRSDASAAEMGVAGVAGVLPPSYVDFKDLIRAEMLAVQQKMAHLRKLHGQAALTTFDDTDSAEVDIEVVTQEVTRLFRKCEAQLQRFGDQRASSEADEKVKRNVQRTLAIELQKLSVQFRKQQKQHLNRLRQRDGGGGTFLAEEAGPSGGAGDDFDPGFTDVQAMKADSMDVLAVERDREVRAILTSIADLAQVMKDLSSLVIDQGTILDRIDYNMEQVAMKVESGVGQLVKAEKTQRQSRLILCIMFLVVAVIIMLLVVVFKKLIL